MRDFKVYLSGKLQGCTPTEARGWRHEATVLLGGPQFVIDPARRWADGSYVDSTPKEKRELVERDLADIEKADYLLVNAWKPGWGTGMETVYAYLVKKPVVIVGPFADVSPWLEYHADFLTTSISSAVTWIRGRAGR